MVEHATENRGVPSSILGLGTLGQSKQVDICGRSTVVVRLLAKEKVVGSNPIARSNMEDCRLETIQSAILIVYMASWPSGKARVCKTLITGSNPVDASKKRVRVCELVFFDLTSQEERKKSGGHYLLQSIWHGFFCKNVYNNF